MRFPTRTSTHIKQIVLILGIFILVCALLIGLLVAYILRPRHYKLQQPQDQIVSLELIQLNEPGVYSSDTVVLAELDSEDYAVFLDALYELDGHWGNVYHLLGAYAARVTYADGSVEHISYAASNYIENGRCQEIMIHFDWEAFRALLAPYVGEERLPVLSPDTPTE